MKLFRYDNIGGGEGNIYILIAKDRTEAIQKLEKYMNSKVYFERQLTEVKEGITDIYINDIEN